jgi:diguanylate cyclase (GGDEF)-like protein
MQKGGPSVGTNVKIALVSHCLSNIIVTLVIFFLWKQNKERFEGISNWLLCFLLQALGMILIAMRGIVPDFLSIVVSNSMIVTGSVFLYFGFADFIKEKILRWPYFVLVGLFFVYYFYFGIIDPSLNMRLTLLYMIIVFLNFQSARILFKRRDIQMQKNYWFTGTVVFLSGLFYLGGLIDNLFKPNGIDYFNKGLNFITLIIVSQIVKFIITFSIIMMINKKLILNLEYIAKVDELTKLWNRRSIVEKLKDELLRSKRYNCEVSVILLDIDFFKKINDNFGHLTGDFVLKKISEILKKNLRETDFIGRWGGEEFIVVCIETNKEGVWAVAEKLRKSVADYDFKLDIPVTISLGIADFNRGENIEDLLDRADTNMYNAKKTGRNKTQSDIYFMKQAHEKKDENFEIVI